MRGSTTTLYLEGLWEEVAGGATKVYYPFNGQMVAVRDSGANVLTYLHGDHLGSVSLATTSGGALASQQEFDPWGKLRSGGIGQTGLNYTGQRLDGTGLLYYHARYYDPALGRFVEPGGGTVVGAVAGAAIDDAIVAGAAAIGITAVLASATSTRYSVDAMGNPVAPVDDAAADEPSAPEAQPAAGPVAPEAGPRAGETTSAQSEATAKQTNPYAEPVDEPVIAVDPYGNAIPVNQRESLTGSPDGRFVQVRDKDGRPTGTRLDGPHRAASHPDPRAQVPHAHVPRMTNPDGTPWLPVRGPQ